VPKHTVSNSLLDTHPRPESLSGERTPAIMITVGSPEALKLLAFSVS
jgi:hypothetical protein